MTQPADLEALERALDAAEQDARALIDGLPEPLGTWRPRPDAWSVAECLDHLATANRVYLAAMRPAAERAQHDGRRRRGPAIPGWIGGLFVRSLEPPVTGRRTRAPLAIRPRQGPPLADAAVHFFAAQDEVRAFLRTFADVDLTGVRFVNPFIRGLRFSLATGLHVIPAHERRHLWQAWRVRREALTANHTS